MVLLALLFSGIAIFLLQLNQEEKDAPAPKKNDTSREDAVSEEEDTPEDLARDSADAEKRQKIYFLVLILVNIAAACFMRAMYQDTVLVIANTLALLAVLWACAWIDKKSFRIPNRILLLGLGMRLIFIAIEIIITPSEFRFVLLTSAIAAGVLLVTSLLCRLISPNAIGFGDVKLLALMGFFLRTDRILGAMIFSMLCAFLYSLYLVAFKKATRKTELAFAPLLLVGTLLAVFLTTV